MQLLAERSPTQDRISRYYVLVLGLILGRHGKGIYLRDGINERGGSCLSPFP